MKSLNESLKESLLVDGSKFNGDEILPDLLSSSDFEKAVNSVSELKVKNLYFIKDTGMGNWYGDYQNLSLMMIYTTRNN